MKSPLPDGIPQEYDYKELLHSDAFAAMEQFSDSFLSSNGVVLQDYTKKWVADPLHQWSRQWEYPFVYDRIQQMVRRYPKPTILDAGSGVTFFPYYLSRRFAGSVHCCDYDDTLAEVYKEINAGAAGYVEFKTADLRNLPYEDGTFHAVYCVSVLEHTDDYGKIVDEFHRVLRPGGTLVVTIDISLDGMNDLDVARGTQLLCSLADRFKTDGDVSFDLKSLASSPGVFTTLTARNIDAQLLPWKYPSFGDRVKSLVKSRRIVSWPPPLTVFCLGLTKESA